MSFTRLPVARVLAASASALSLAVAAQGHAQEASEETSGGIGEIVVTAQKVKENIQTVPIAISAVTVASNCRIGPWVDSVSCVVSKLLMAPPHSMSVAMVCAETR